MDVTSMHEPIKSPKQVQHIFGRISGVYDKLNTLLSFGFDSVWRSRLVDIAVEGLTPHSAPLLDLAAGTLKVTKKIAKKKPGLPIISADFCAPMLKEGVASLSLHPETHVLPVIANALSLPLASESVSAITVAFGLRNFLPRDRALTEMYRVLKPGGKLCILEFGSAKDEILFGVYNWYLSKVLPLIGSLISNDQKAYKYLADTIVAFPSGEELAKEIKDQGFKDVTHTPLTAGIVRLHVGIKP